MQRKEDPEEVFIEGCMLTEKEPFLRVLEYYMILIEAYQRKKTTECDKTLF